MQTKYGIVERCTGNECPLKDKCERYLNDETYIQYMPIVPFTYTDGHFICHFFWGAYYDYINEQLKGIPKNPYEKYEK